MVNILIEKKILKTHHIQDRMIQIWCEDGSDNEEDIEELIKLKAKTIGFSDIIFDG